MKKIYFLFIILILCGCKNKSVIKVKEKNDISSVKVYTKKLYSYKVSYIDHDDFLNVKKSSTKTNSITNAIYDENKVYDESLDDMNNYVSDDETKDIEKMEENSNEVKNEENSNEVVILQDGLEKNNDIVEEKEKIKVEDNTTKNESITLEKSEETTTNPPVEVKKGYYSPSGKYLGETKVKVIDVSYYQKDINWDLFYKESDCYGVILRLGYYETLDKKFEKNISEIKRLNIPYGIYLFSYSSTINGSLKEANFTNKMIDKYDLNPTLGIYYDIESWSTKTSNSNNITKSMYDNIITTYITNVTNHINYRYKVKVYSGRWYAMNRLGPLSKKYVDWVAEYNKTCKYDSYYSMWQYTSKGRVPGINGNVDISYLY